MPTAPVKVNAVFDADAFIAGLIVAQWALLCFCMVHIKRKIKGLVA